MAWGCENVSDDLPLFCFNLSAECNQQCWNFEGKTVKKRNYRAREQITHFFGIPEENF
jgi:hypothetical protein